MRGGVKWQINQIFQKSGIFRPGESKHEDKEAAKTYLATENMTATSQRISQRTTIHSIQTGYDYKETWEAVGKHAREVFGLKDMTQISEEHVRSYLEQRVLERVSHSTWRKEAAHCGKLGNALSLQSEKTVDFRDAVNDMRADAKDVLTNPEQDRGFVEPREVIAAIKNEQFRLIATIQLEGGARVHEVMRVHERQLVGANQIHLENTKGGKPRTIIVQPETYDKLKAAVRAQGGALSSSQSAYRTQVYRAALEVGEDNTGTHDFRYNYAQGRYVDLTKEGMTPESAHQEISWEMGHERADITMHYL